MSHTLREKMEVQKSLILIGLGGFAFIIEVLNLLDYIVGARLALINYDPGVATGLIIMSVTRLGMLYMKWMFWIKRWRTVLIRLDYIQIRLYTVYC